MTTDENSSSKLSRIAWLEKNIAEIQEQLQSGEIAGLAVPEYKKYLNFLRTEITRAEAHLCPTCHGEGVVYGQ